MGTCRLGSLTRHPYAKRLIANCCYDQVCVPAVPVNAKKLKIVTKACSCSLPMPSDNIPELRHAEKCLVLWLLAGTVMSAPEHMELAATLAANFRN